MTLLEIVQQILSDMDGDEVNTVSDTEESEQVARHVVRTFSNIINTRDWLHTRELLKLTPRSDTSFPTHFSVPDNVRELLLINYDKRKLGETRKNYQAVVWKEPDDFLRYLNKRDSTDSNTKIVTDDSGIELLIKSNSSPSYYTSFDDHTVIMDSFNSEVEDTLQGSKLQAWGFVIPTLLMEDDAVIDLPQDAVSLLIEEATARAQFKSREFNDVISRTEAMKQNIVMSRKQWTVNGGIKYPNYGRKR